MQAESLYAEYLAEYKAEGSEGLHLILFPESARLVDTIIYKRAHREYLENAVSNRVTRVLQHLESYRQGVVIVYVQ